MAWTLLHGILAQGYRVASGPSADYPYGALDRQRPIFTARGLNLGTYFNGTLNIDISPANFEMKKPEYTFESVEWTDLHPPEHFSFSRCKVIHKQVEYDGWVYYPHPETKLRNFQNPALLEVIAQPIPEIKYGDAVDVLVNTEEISISFPGSQTPNEPRKLESYLNRKRLIAGVSILAILVILSITGVGFLVSRLKNNQPQAHQRSPILSLGYCNSNDIKPCIVSFSVDADGNMLVNILIPKSTYPAFYLTITKDGVVNTYKCRKVKGFSTNVYCIGRQMYPGEALQFNIISNRNDTVLAEGNFAIIGLLLGTPDTEAVVSAPATEAPTAATEPPIILEILTPVPTELTPSYPNPSYP